MKYFVIEGQLKIQGPIDENIMNEHIAHSQKAIANGLTLMTGLKADISGGLSIMKANSIEEIEAYLAADPLKVSGVQEYIIKEFTPHFVQTQSSEWSQN